MDFANFTKGCAILQKYYSIDQKYPMNPSHDMIYLEPTKFPISTEDFNSLVALDWIQEDWDDSDTLKYLVDSYWICYT